eukprot:8708288-Ditylum_brightwellii.AAC.1
MPDTLEGKREKLKYKRGGKNSSRGKKKKGDDKWKQRDIQDVIEGGRHNQNRREHRRSTDVQGRVGQRSQKAEDGAQENSKHQTAIKEFSTHRKDT